MPCYHKYNIWFPEKKYTHYAYLLIIFDKSIYQNRTKLTIKIKKQQWHLFPETIGNILK